MNRFFEWIGLKEKLHRSEHKAPFVSERDLWWASLGQNVGSDGKGDRFSRPVLIMRKLAHGFYLVAPTTTKSREGTWYVHVRLSNLDEYVCLNQIRTIDYRRLSSKAGQIETLFRCVGGSEDVPHAASPCMVLCLCVFRGRPVPGFQGRTCLQE